MDIWNKKVDIWIKKVDIETISISNIMKINIRELYSKLSNKECFGRKEVISVLSLSNSGASKLISKFLEMKLIVPIKNKGKGKYIFNIAE